MGSKDGKAGYSKRERDVIEGNMKLVVDPVNSPTHYQNGGIETIELIKEYLTPEEFRGYLKGNVIKYRERAPYKGNAEQDYAKALKYWEWLKVVTE